MKSTNFFETFISSVSKPVQNQKVERVMFFEKPDDFKQIRMLPFNRDARFRQDLADNMNLFGFSVAVTLIYTDLFSEGDEKGKFFFYAADGQHRIITAMQLGLTVVGLVSEHKFSSVTEIVQFVASLNSTQKEWSPMNYVDCYVSLEIQAYQTLVNIKKVCPFTLTTVALMLYGFRSKGAVAKAIKSGDFVCNYLNETMFTLKAANVLNKAMKKADKKAKGMTSRMVLGLHSVTMRENFDLEKFTAKYVENYKEVRDMNLDDYSDEFASWL